MLFDVIEDKGATISAYVVPDSMEAIPSLRVTVAGKVASPILATERLPALIAAGRHSSGLCGFTIDASVVADLEAHTALELQEAETGLLVYRRALAGMVRDCKLFRLETGLLPAYAIDDALKPYFQGWFKNIERHGLETSTQTFCQKDRSSNYVSGRLFYKNYEYYLSQISCFALLRDPYCELAERLLVLRYASGRAEQVFGSREAIIFDAMLRRIASYPTVEHLFQRKFFAGAARGSFLSLADPLVRQLTTSTPDELPGKNAVAAALEVLSGFELVGIRSEAQLFIEALAASLGVPTEILPIVDERPQVAALADTLREVPEVTAILEKDLELYYIVASAFRNVVEAGQAAKGNSKAMGSPDMAHAKPVELI